ncbi:hypothetical protein NYO98_10555 [Nocardioides sp. STR2]|uniref:Uncharacterized protein n=1 Tax=Nocardioides pini TaxID=2975053 RepID=A0ABT4CFH7_9ACTN|nr:hypothetical protein [Nocardioides pini]MCY4726719.1 hypothetical protein [Nocardioides pini]
MAFHEWAAAFGRAHRNASTSGVRQRVRWDRYRLVWTAAPVDAP